MENAKDIYSPPESEIAAQTGIRPGIGIIITAIVLTGLACVIPVIKVSFTGYPLMYVAAIFGTVIPALLVVFVFQIGKRFRNPRSRWKIYSWSQVLVLFSQVWQLMRAAMSV